MKPLQLLAVALSLFICTISHAQEAPFIDGDLIVMLNEGHHPDQIIQDFQFFNGSQTQIEYVKELSKISKIHLFKVNHELVNQHEVLALLQNSPSVRAAQLNHIVEQRATTPNDPSFGSQWHHVDASDNDIDSDLAWDTTTGGQTLFGHDVVVCVVELDGGVYNHPDIIANHWVNTGEIENNGVDDDGNGYVDDYHGWNAGNNSDNMGSDTHGTSVMGMVGAKGNNSTGVAGVNWDVDIMLVDVGSVTESGVIAAYAYPQTFRNLWNSTGGAQGELVVATNSSWGIDGANPASYPVWCAYYNDLGQDGILNCGATTNLNADVDVVGDMPTGCSSPYMIGISQTNSSDVRVGGYGGSTIELAAPGSGVYLTTGASSYGFVGGTSFASPCVAGAIGLLYSAPCADLASLAINDPQGAADLVRQVILDGVDPVPGLVGEVSTGGRLNVNNSLNQVMAFCGVPSCTACGLNCLNIAMEDSFGDGWNGAEYIITDNNSGLQVASGTLASGSFGVDEICLATGCYTIAVGGGSFDSEITWLLSGNDGPDINGVANSPWAFSVGGACVGCTSDIACNYDPSALADDGSCCYSFCATIDMTDSFGDGWNGATWDVFDDNGLLVASGTLAGGLSGSDNICLNPGCYSLSVGGGSFDSEIGWTLSGVDNGPLAGGAPGQVAFAIGGAFCGGCNDPANCAYDPWATTNDGSCCFANCITLNMFDSFGDGWDTGSYTITNLDSGSIITGTLSSGSFGQEIICVVDGCYSIHVSGSFFDSEISWDLSGTDQGTLFGGSPDTQYFSVGGVLCSGCTDAAACNYNPVATIADGTCCYQNCVQFNMFDSFGDGWNGGEYFIYDVNTGAIVGQGTLSLSEGSSGSDLLCLPDGCYSLSVSGGTFPSEISWAVTGIDGGSLSGGAPADTFFTIGGTTCNGCTDPVACNYDFWASADNGSCCFDNCLTIELYDSFGDGWDGGTYSIINQSTGLSVESGTLSFGSAQIQDVCLPDGCYTFVVQGSAFDSEISWILNGTDQGSLSGGSPEQQDFSIGGSCPGCIDTTACNFNPIATVDDFSCCYANCLTLGIFDSFGDGWNGAEYEVKNVGTNIVVTTGTLASGTASLIDLCLSTGCYTISVGGGSFDSEISWLLSGTDAGTLSGGAPDLQGFTVGGGTCFGCTDTVACNYEDYASVDDGTCCYENCLTLDMTDNFGDGWNGGDYVVLDFNTGLELLSGTLSTGLAGCATLCLPDGCYILYVGGGTFDSEIGWVLNGADQGTLAGGAPSETTFTLGGGACFGCTDSFACNYEPDADTPDGSCCYSQCLELTLSDSFGDGWNGAEYTIIDNDGWVAANGTLADGTVQIIDLCLPTGCYSIIVGGGAFDSEISWSLAGTDAGTISGGATASTLFTLGTPASCGGCTDIAACNFSPAADVDDGSCCYSNCLSIEMLDSFGDGWDSGTYTIWNTNLGVPVATGGLINGSIGNDNLCLAAGCYEITVGGSSFNSEISWVLSGTDAGDITGTSPTSIEFAVGGGCFGCMNSTACNYQPLATISGTCCFDNCLELEKNDSFGDGWNGAEYIITDNNSGLQVATGTLTSGSLEIDDLCLSSGCYSISVGGGGFDSEISWSLSGTDSGTIAGGAPVTQYFTVAGGVCEGCTDTTACNFDPGATTDDGSCCYNNCVEFVMMDSFGDGWNGGTYEVVDTFGAVILSGTMPTGSVQTINLCLPNGCYGLVTGGGSFPSEISWNLNGTDAGPLSGAAPSETAFTLGLPASCGGCTDNTACNYSPAATSDNGTCCYSNCLSLEMSDGFGDGWDTGSYTILDLSTGLSVATGTLASGSFGIDYLCLTDGCFRIVVGGSTFDSEISWVLTNTNQGDLAGGSPNSVDFTLGGGCSGCTDPVACNYQPLAGSSDGSCCYDNCATLTMEDAFGDGWNGATYQIFDAGGALVTSGTLTIGTLGFANLCLPTGCYSIEVGGGSFDSEITWTLDGADGGTISGFAPQTVNFGMGGATCSCLGDFNGDGLRNTTDLLLFLAEFGCLSGCSTDMNGDGAVNTTDLLMFLSVFGVPC